MTNIDIVQELRYAAGDHDSTGYVMEKAADEIERLRAAIVQHRKATGGQWCAANEADAGLYRALEQRGPSYG